MTTGMMRDAQQQSVSMYQRLLNFRPHFEHTGDSRIDELRGKRIIFAASTGGHLSQLVRLAPAIGARPDSVWVTFDSPQSRALLRGQRVRYVPYVKPRDARGVLRAALQILPLVSHYDGAISTGAGLALSVLPAVSLAGKPAVYLESISRVTGPSLSGRILARFPLVPVYSQHDYSHLGRRWQRGPSVLGQYVVSSETAPTPPRRILVTLGTIRPYRFDRMIDTVLAYVRKYPTVEVLWQVGCTDRADLPGRVVEQLSEGDFLRAIDWADVIVAHAGVGVCMSILDKGRVPVLLPRNSALSEHVDDHQEQIWRYLLERGLAYDAAYAFEDPERIGHIASLRVNGVAQ